MSCTDVIARTGRVQSWLDDPESRLPVSCTVFVVEDSIEGPNGIEASWRFASHALRYGAGVAIHLSKLRPEGTENGKGLVASGPVSFAKIYSTLNEIIRRGGVYKNGAITLHLDITHQDIIKYITTDRTELPWVKRCVDLTPLQWYESSREVKDALLQGIRNGDIWLSKIKHDQKGRRISSNVCLEVYLSSRGTCLLEHLNLGACEIDDIPKAFTDGMTELCSLHGKTGVGDSGEYLSPEEDKQVGLGVLGLANLLARFGVTYNDFGRQVEIIGWGGKPENTPAGILAGEIQKGIDAAANVARHYGMARAFCIAPTASCSYNYKDLDGYTTAPEIAPPISRQVDRDSGTFGVTSYDYGPNIEIASEVGWKDFRRVADGLVRMYEKTGLFHGYSLNSWSDLIIYDDAFIEEWLKSPQTSLYYSLQVRPDILRKDDATADLDEEYQGIFDPVAFENFERDETELSSTECTPDFCPSCAE
ncbi:ribonucleotide reductase [Cyanophage SS120-1]|uniref:Ribonucleotide reductase n=1 Tax=Cyanophage SS120-1 TaxID=616674 RepID=M1T374_9CAUD|nr:ribonucleotide reductase [Cyanophage SS120-1]AGG54545.1 ribonucleotide reductase [Cyanophage SS120-1]